MVFRNLYNVQEDVPNGAGIGCHSGVILVEVADSDIPLQHLAGQVDIGNHLLELLLSVSRNQWPVKCWQLSCDGANLYIF